MENRENITIDFTPLDRYAKLDITSPKCEKCSIQIKTENNSWIEYWSSLLLRKVYYHMECYDGIIADVVYSFTIKDKTKPSKECNR